MTEPIDIDALEKELTHGAAGHKDPSPSAIIKNVKAYWSGIKSGEIKFLAGLPLLEDYIPAYIPGHLISVSGYTSAGKSQILSQLIAWTSGIKESNTLVFSLEDSQDEKLMSLVSVVSDKVHRKQMLLGDLGGVEKEVDACLDQINHWPLAIYDSVYQLDEMERLIKKHAPKVIVLDYIQNISGAGNLYEKMSSAAARVFRMAQENKATFFVASQIDNESARNESSGFIAMKGGGELAAASHTVIHLKKGRDESTRNRVLIQIKKNKAFGACGEIEAYFNERWTKIEKGDQWTV